MNLDEPLLGPKPQTTEQALIEAAALHQSGDLQEAEKRYLAILQIEPHQPKANHNLGVLYSQQNQPASGLSHLVAALDADPANGQYWLSYIDCLFQAGQVKAAQEVLALARRQGLQGAGIEALAARLGATTQPARPPDPGSRQSPSPSADAQSIRKNAKARTHAHKGNSPGARETDALVALFNSGRLAEAETLARSMTEHFPQHGFGWKALGTVLKQMGRNAESLLPLQRAAALSPNEADAHSNLGVALQDMGRLDEAEASYRRALKIKPDYADAYCNLGTMLQDMGRLQEAEACHRRALRIKPDLAEAHYNLGNTLREQGRPAEAADSYRNALHIKPAYVQACCNLGAVLNDQGLPAEAETILRRALELKPDYTEAHSNLGNTLKELGRLAEAELSYRKALELKPDLAEAHNNLGILLQELGALEQAEACYRQALRLKPDYHKAHSNLLFLLNYNPAVAPAAAFAEACEYGRKVAGEVPSRFMQWSCVKQPARLRIGFVSGDFRNHPVGYFLENLLRHLDRTAFELIAYPTDPWTDELTARIKPYFSAWKPLVGLSDEAAARLMHGDGVHVLIDLSGHSRYNRLPVFAWKPAPVQVAWLGYFATTGVAAVDYLIADPVTLPESEERNFTEKIWRLPETRLCFTPPDVGVEVSPLPALANGHVTFACFNNLAKMNDDVVALWSRVLTAVPDSRLFLKSRQLGEDSVRLRTMDRFAVHGIPAERLILEGAESRAKYFEAYHRVDIALDPFPYPGGTTTVESLWMGVPVLNLSGESFLFRQGAGFLSNAGLPEWVANSQEEYVAWAVSYAADRQGLATLRSGLRQRLERSPIMDGKRFANHFAAALTDMWRVWCESHGQ
ncbi:MAG: tetratricopeptide repeat protein [Nitrosomonadales bacterium]|nr:tetratricopeptide repeat protein [Nitrosomonadales bacterium]